MGMRFLTGGEYSLNGIIGLAFVLERSMNEDATAIQHVSKRNVFAMLDWLHEQQAKPRKELFNQKEVLYDQNRSINVGL